ncbi:MAG: hypothetical protein AAF518_05825 [Spirochaetota bacterium]
MKNSRVTSSQRLSFASNIPSNTQGTIYYKVYRLESNISHIRFVKTCYLQHGYGIDARMVSFKRLTFDTFVHTYYSLQAIHELLASACGEVIVAMQESNQTSILQMTQRTERFIKDRVCQSREIPILYQKECAFIGHSKGGAVAFNIARRCMQKTSLLQEAGCKRLQEIYSSTGVIQGAQASFAVYGAYLDKDKEDQENFVKFLGFGINLVLPAFQAYEAGKSNPTWFDLSPGAPMEKRKPLFVTNDISLKRQGWLVGNFAASGVGFVFKGNEKEELMGCGAKDRWEYNYNACRIFGKRVSLVHSKRLQRSFTRGLQAAQKNPLFTYKDKNKYLENFSWQSYQKGDGLADLYLSLHACRKGLAVAEKERIVRACTVLPPMNHLATAGGNELALREIIKQLAEN